MHDDSTTLQGFSMIPNWMLADERVTLQMIGAYAALASYGDRTGSAFPGVPALAKRAKMGTTALREALMRLRDLGVVQWVARARQDGGQTTNLYRIAVHERGLAAPVPLDATPLRQAEPPLRDTVGAPPSGVDEQDPEEQHSLPPKPPQGGQPRKPRAPRKPLEGEVLEAFETFWAAYPYRHARRTAEAAFVKALERAPLALIVGGAMAYAEDPNRDPGFTKHPSTWLNGDCWADDPLPARAPETPADAAVIAERAAEAARRRDRNVRAVRQAVRLGLVAADHPEDLPLPPDAQARLDAYWARMNGESGH